ncbi:MAG TPA: cobalamin biosynthesis protein [Actinoplanes sp.]|nr:cobalamin biosynthesis protein [Actinoplanes sp.]
MIGVVAVGVGFRPGTDVADLGAAVGAVLAAAGLTEADVDVLATLDRRSGEPGIRRLASGRGWPVAAFPAAELGRREVPNPSGVVGAAVGTPGVAEAAALCAAGPSSVLVVPKRVVGGVTVAVARG